MSQVHVINHPLVQHKLTILRNKSTGTKLFREVAREISKLLGYEAMHDLKTELTAIETPLCKIKSPQLPNKLSLISILRAGLIMADAINELVPNASMGHIGIYRDPNTHLPIQYYYKLPTNIASHDIFLLDPMLATGGSIIKSVDILKEQGARKIKLVCILAAPEGIHALHKQHPDVTIYTTAIDEALNDNAYIVPGLGDAGDRIFGTKS